MARPRIKICGIGRVEDALAAARAGADAIGLVFHKPAARYVHMDRAREILAALPPFVTPVGLFVDAAPSSVLALAGGLGLRHIQLQGHEDAAYVASMAPMAVLKAIHVDRQTFTADLQAWRREIAAHHLVNLRGFVLETASSEPGGTGIANDWAFVRECQMAGMFEGLPPIIAAGGLRPETVAAVVRDVRPWAVDVSTGVEVSKGIKSAEKIVAFVHAASEAFAQ